MDPWKVEMKRINGQQACASRLRLARNGLLFLAGIATGVSAQDAPRLYDLSPAESRSITAENPTGARGAGGNATEGTGKESAGDLGVGWKISPFKEIKAGQTLTVADISAEGVINHIWMTPVDRGPSRKSLILRIYWDGETSPSVEVPLGDFFASGLGDFAQVSSQAVAVNPGLGLNSYWQMPFRRQARITVENRSRTDNVLAYTVDYSLEKVSRTAAYFHAEFHDEARTKGNEPYVILDHVKGAGQYVGTYMTYGVRHPGWWGEGEIKFYLDGETSPTIVGTGTEDYFGGSHNFIPAEGRSYTAFTAPYSGLAQVIRPEDSGQPYRFGMYRWHLLDPIRFKSGLKVTIQMLGWKQSVPYGYDQLQEHVSSVAYWYQTEPHEPYPALPAAEDLE